MSEALGQSLIVAITAVVSGGVGLVGGLLIEQARSRAARQARIEARQDQRNDFQRSTLLELQEAVARHGRAVFRAQHLDTMAYKEMGEWGRNRLGEVSEELRHAQVQLRMLAERVTDDEMRPLIYGFANRGTLVSGATSQEQAQARMDDYMEYHGKLEDRLGVVLRSYL